MNKEPIKVSVIVPVYNVEKYIRKCLDSLIGQSYKNIEIILVDDGSSDKSGLICDEYAQLDSRFSILHQSNQGVAKSRLRAFEVCTGDYVTFVDSDDYVDLFYIEKLIYPVIKYNVDIVTCNYRYVWGSKVRPGRMGLSGLLKTNEIKEFLSDRYFYDKTAKGYCIPIFLCTKLIKREYAFIALQSGLGLTYGEDQVGLFAVMKRIDSFYAIDEVLYNYVQHDNQVTRSYSDNIWDSIIALSERYQSIDVDNSCIAGLRKRSWLHIRHTLNKMANSVTSFSEFKEEMKALRKKAFISSFFQPVTIDMNLIDKVLYFFIRKRVYFPIYFLFRI